MSTDLAIEVPEDVLSDGQVIFASRSLAYKRRDGTAAVKKIAKGLGHRRSLCDPPERGWISRLISFVIATTSFVVATPSRLVRRRRARKYLCEIAKGQKKIRQEDAQLNTASVA